MKQSQYQVTEEPRYCYSPVRSYKAYQQALYFLSRRRLGRKCGGIRDIPGRGFSVHEKGGLLGREVSTWGGAVGAMRTVVF